MSSDLGTGPLFDALDAPLPSDLERERQRERERASERDDATQTVATPRREIIPERPKRDIGPRKPTVTRRRRVKPATRRVKRTIKHIDPLGVLKVSLIMYTLFLGLWLVFVAIVYSFLDSLGLFDAIEKLGKELVLWDQAVVSLGSVERYAFIIGLVMMIIGLLANVFLAFLYNIIADLVGGVELTFVERDSS